MPVSPQDFELYSRMTGAPMPTDAMSRMQMAPDVYNFTKNFARKPNLFEKTGNLVKNIGKGAVMALGAPLVAASEAENARMQEQLRNKADKAESEAVSMSESPEQVSEKLQIEQEKTRRKQIEVTGRLDLENMRMTGQPSTTAGNYGQNVVINSTAQNVIDKKMEQGSQMADSVPNIAEVLSESEESQPVSLYGTNPLNVPRLMSEDVGTTASPEFISKFRKKRGLDKALKGVFKLGQQEEELVDDNTIVQSGSPLNDHPDVKDVSGGEEPNPRMGTNTSPTENLNDYYKEMRKMDAMERNKEAIDQIVGKTPTPSEMQVGRSPNELAGKDQSAFEAIQAGIPQEERDAARMRLKEKTAKKRMSRNEYAKIHSDFKSDDPNNPRTLVLDEQTQGTKSVPVEFTDDVIAPPSALDKANGFLSNFPPQSIIRYGQMGSKASGIELNPSPNGEPTIGFAISDPKSKKTTKYTYPAPKDVFKEIGQDPDDPATPEESIGRRKFNYLLGLAGRGERGIGERTKKEDFDTFVDISKLGGYLP